MLTNGIWMPQYPVPAPDHLGGGYLGLVDALGDEHAAEKFISWCEDEGKAFERLAVQGKSK